MFWIFLLIVAAPVLFYLFFIKRIFWTPGGSEQNSANPPLSKDLSIIVLSGCVLGIFLLIWSGTGSGDPKLPEFKRCIYCHEEDIKVWASVCKHCGRDPDGRNGPSIRNRVKKEVDKE